MENHGDSQPRPLSSLTDLDLKGYLNDCIKTFAQDYNAQIATTVCAAVAPIQETQREMAADLEATKSRVSEMASDYSDTKAKVDELQLTFQQFLNQGNKPHPHNPSPSAARPSLGPQIVPPQHPQPQHQLQTQTHPHTREAAVNVVHQSRRILGFSPIVQDDIDFLKKKHSVEDIHQAMKLAVIEFLNDEMKVPKSVTDKLSIKRIFPPAKQLTGWKTLYTEFNDISTSELINQYVTNLQPGKSVSIYVPHSLYPRFSAIRDLEHSYRHGDIRHKTKVKYGTSDFVLLVKPRDTVHAPWTYVSLDSLPPLELSPYNGNPSLSPPPGRSRLLSSKRARSDSPDADIARNNKTKLDDENVAPINDHVGDSPNEELVLPVPVQLQTPADAHLDQAEGTADIAPSVESLNC